VPSITSGTTIGLSWQEGPNNGGTDVIDYLVVFAQSTDTEYQTLEASITETTYTAINLTPGITYKFKVQARNAYGYGDYSDEVFILAAQIPDTPAAPVTTFLTDTVQVDWVAPFNQGFAIQGYRIFFLQSDGIIYSLELNNCDGTDAAIRDAQQCFVNVSTLRGAPFSLAWGSSIYAKVQAYNFYGDSQVSEPGNGAVIITFPDAPIELIETVASRTSSSITFSWSLGENDGGNTVKDFRISSDGAIGVYSVLATGVVPKTYTATGLTYGLSYRFKVEARNDFGYSELSEEVLILCATHPEKPSTPTTEVVNNFVIFDWEAPIDNGTPITAYKVYIRKADLTFEVDNDVCDGANLVVIQNTQCTLPLTSLQAIPFELQLGYTIQIQVQAINAYGSSPLSEVGNGGVMVLVPDAVTNMQDDPTVTNDSRVRLTWSDGASNGGENVIDYRIWYD
jgi:hypothetical protein